VGATGIEEEEEEEEEEADTPVCTTLSDNNSTADVPYKR
jgi:hypothetical protein